MFSSGFYEISKNMFLWNTSSIGLDWVPDQSAWKDIDAESVQKDFVILTASFRGFAEISCAGFNFAIALIDLEQQNAYK